MYGIIEVPSGTNEAFNILENSFGSDEFEASDAITALQNQGLTEADFWSLVRSGYISELT